MLLSSSSVAKAKLLTALINNNYALEAKVLNYIVIQQITHELF